MIWTGNKLLLSLMLLIAVLIERNSLTEEEPSKMGQKSLADVLDSSSGCTQRRQQNGMQVVNCSFQSFRRLLTFPDNHKPIILDMSDNYIDKLDVFKNLNEFSNLVSLNLENNSLDSVGRFFKDMNLKKLEEIDLSFNKLTHCCENILNTGIPNVKRLNLKGNMIQVVSVSGLNKTGTLQVLDLSSNSISRWNFLSTNDNFSQSSSILESLSLSDNKISKLTESAFVFMDGLKELNLSHNILSQLQDRTFATLFKLKVLDLSHNKLFTLPGKLFTKLDNLRYLYLSENDLITFPDAIPILNWFDISFNKISKIEEALNHVIYPHEVILLGGNPFICDCNILWLKEFYDTREYLLKFIDVGKDKFIPSCEFPESLKGDSWDVIGDAVFKCEDKADRHFQDAIVTDDVKTENKISIEIDEGITDFKASYVGTDYIRLEWVVSYAFMVRLTYRIFGTTNKKEAAVLPTTVTSFVLRNLDANSPYIICISLTKELNFDGREEKENCIEIITNKHEYGSNKDGLIWTPLKGFAEILFCYQLSFLLALSVIILCFYFVYLKRHVKVKEKQN